MCEWFHFHVDQEAKVIIIEVDSKTLLENQPATQQEADTLCTETIFPLIDQLREMCIKNRYHQVCTVDLKDVDITLLNPIVLIRIIWNIYEHNKQDPEFLVKGFYVENSNTLFRTIFSACKYLLPEYMKNLITIA